MKKVQVRFRKGQRVKYLGAQVDCEEFGWARELSGTVYRVPGEDTLCYHVEMDDGCRSPQGAATVLADAIDLIALAEPDQTTCEIIVSTWSDEMWKRVLRLAPRELVKARAQMLSDYTSALGEIPALEDSLAYMSARHDLLSRFIRDEQDNVG